MGTTKRTTGQLMNTAELRDLFLRLYSDSRRDPELFGSNLAVPLNNRLLHMKITLAHSHWSPEPFSAHLRVEDLPVRQSTGMGDVDFIALIMPIKPKPKVHEVNVNRVRRSRNIGSIDKFINEFCRNFKSEWNH